MLLTLATTLELAGDSTELELVDDTTLMGREAVIVGVAPPLLGVFPMNERMSSDPEPEVEGVEGVPEAAGLGTMGTLLRAPVVTCAFG